MSVKSNNNQSPLLAQDDLLDVLDLSTPLTETDRRCLAQINSLLLMLLYHLQKRILEDTNPQ